MLKSVCSIKKIKAPIGDENKKHPFHNLFSFYIKKIKAPIGDENADLQFTLK